jgi:hypothetical protein
MIKNKENPHLNLANTMVSVTSSKRLGKTSLAVVFKSRRIKSPSKEQGRVVKRLTALYNSEFY